MLQCKICKPPQKYLIQYHSDFQIVLLFPVIHNIQFYIISDCKNVDYYLTYVVHTYTFICIHYICTDMEPVKSIKVCNTFVKSQPTTHT